MGTAFVAWSTARATPRRTPGHASGVLLMSIVTEFSRISQHLFGDSAPAEVVLPNPPPRGIVQTSLGGIHYVSAGSINAKLSPVLAFHMVARSSDEFREVMPLLTENDRLIIAIDEMGHGSSDNPLRTCTLDDLADCALEVLDFFGVSQFVVCGSLTGNVFALSLASRYPQRVTAAVLTNCTYAVKVKAPFQEVVSPEEDGSHLLTLFNKRHEWLDTRMNNRATRDDIIFQLKKRERLKHGITIQEYHSYEFETAAQKTTCAVFCVQGLAATEFFDQLDFALSEQLQHALSMFPNLSVAHIDGHVNCINTHGELWHSEVSEFLEEQEL